MQRTNERSAIFIIGFSDGLVLPIAMITALMRLTENTISLFQIGLLCILAFAVVMGLSNYYTRRNHVDTSIKTGTFKGIGLSADLEEQLLKDHEQEKQEWEQVLAEHKLIHYDAIASWITGFAYLASGIILLTPFLFFPEAQAYRMSCIICGTFILVFGILKARVTDNHPVRVAVRGLIYAGVLSGLAYGVMSIFMK